MEIKVKAYDLDKKEMFDVYQIQFQDNGITVRKRGSLHKSENAPKNVVLIQFTGLHDLHGKEIWEGDRVRWHEPDIENYDDIVENVTFADGAFCHGTVPFCEIDMTRIEVIGDIFEGGE